MPDHQEQCTQLPCIVAENTRRTEVFGLLSSRYSDKHCKVTVLTLICSPTVVNHYLGNNVFFDVFGHPLIFLIKHCCMPYGLYFLENSTN